MGIRIDSHARSRDMPGISVGAYGLNNKSGREEIVLLKSLCM